MKKKIIITIVIVVVSLFSAAGVWLAGKQEKWTFLSPLGSRQSQIKEKPLEKYELERLKKRGAQASEISLGKILYQDQTLTSYIFSYTSLGRKITGLANIPKRADASFKRQGQDLRGAKGIIVMLRGYVDQEKYKTGIGTEKAGKALAQNGYITLAPDYLGYGGSDMPPDNVWEERFLRAVSITDLLASIRANLSKNGLKVNPEKIGIWGHSNGGLTALVVLELTGGNYPTTLWAPVSQFFPYDILYYTWEFADRGKALRKSLAQFEADYDAEKYSFDNFLSWIKAPIQLHQGEADPYIPLVWSDRLAKKLQDLDLEVNYFNYPGAGHNMEGSWNLVVQRDVQFFNQKLK